MNPVLFSLALIMLFNISMSKTIRIGSHQSYKTIKSGLAVAQDHDTVLVENGFYKEGNIIIDKSIVFKGENLPIIDGDRKFEVLSVKANHVTICGFKVQHSSYATMDDPGGIKIYDSENVTIENNELFDNFFGIYIQYGKNCIVKNNKIVAFGKEEQQIGNGIHCWKSDSLQIIGNNISGHRDGIYFEFVTKSVIWRNISQGNIRYGLHFMFSNDDSYITNIFAHNEIGRAHV